MVLAALVFVSVDFGFGLTECVLVVLDFVVVAFVCLVVDVGDGLGVATGISAFLPMKDRNPPSPA